MTSHLLGLNFTCQRSAHRSRVVRSDCKAIESSTLFIAQWILVSSANNLGVDVRYVVYVNKEHNRPQY